jgi:hypothetical protein
MNFAVGDRIEVRGIDHADAWNGRRGTIKTFDMDLGDAAIVVMDGPPSECPGCRLTDRANDRSCLHRFVFKYLRKLSLLELIAEAAQ